MLNKLWAGLQPLKVDTQLDNVVVQAGDTLTGSVVFFGTTSDKKINRLDLHLKTLAEIESGDNEYHENLSLASWMLKSHFVIPADKKTTIPFAVQLPYEMPITQVNCYLNKSKVWIETAVDVDWGIDARDKDMLGVVATPAMADFLLAMEQCGFSLHSADVEKGYLNGGHFRSTVGCYQELEFRPHRGGFGNIGEIEVSFVPTPTQTHIVLEIDRRGFFGGNDTYRTLTIDHNHYNVNGLVGQIKSLIGL